jgi:uncharacterized protein GlcG (DUF336 family)
MKSLTIAILLGAGSLAVPANDILLVQHALSAQAAFQIAQGAVDKCGADGYHISLTILDSAGQVKLSLRGDSTGPHTLEHSRKKSYTALTFKRSSAETAKAWESRPTPPPAIEGTVAAGGGVPIKVGNEVIGAIGVSGAPGGDKDEACALAGIAKVSEQLKP